GAPGCTGYTADGPDLVYKLTLNPGQGATIGVVPSISYDVSLYVLDESASAICSNLSSCVAGSDVGYSGDPETVVIPPPSVTTTYDIIVDGYGSSGAFSMGINP